MKYLFINANGSMWYQNDLNEQDLALNYNFRSEQDKARIVEVTHMKEFHGFDEDGNEIWKKLKFVG